MVTSMSLQTGEMRQRVKALVNFFSETIEKFKPTHVVFNDPITMKLTATHPNRVSFKRVNIIHSAEQLPFGPYAAGVEGHCYSPAAENELLRGLDGIWSVSQALTDYARIHGNLETKFLVHPLATYLDKGADGKPTRPVVRDNIDKDEVGMVNPCPQKGSSILIEVARQLPHIKFVVWKSWGTRADIVARLEALPNVTYVV